MAVVIPGNEEAGLHFPLFCVVQRTGIVLSTILALVAGQAGTGREEEL